MSRGEDSASASPDKPKCRGPRPQWPAVPEGIVVLRDGLERYLATGTRISLEFALSLLADVQARGGDVVGALATLADAEGAVLGKEVWRADTLRRRAELLAREGAAAAEIERVFGDALAVARRQGARAYELRAAVAYGRFLRDHGRAGEGRALLAPVYAWFTEGFDTRDLVEAKALLDELT